MGVRLKPRIQGVQLFHQTCARSINLDHIQGSEQFLDMVEISLAAKALQHFGQNQIANHQQLTVQQFVKALGLGGGSAAEEVDPDAGIDHDHLSVLIA